MIDKIKKIALSVLLCVFLSSLIFSEISAEPLTQALPQYFYKRLEGTINGKYQVVMHLNRKGHNLDGWYYYATHRIKIAITGKIEPSGEFLLEEYTKTDKGSMRTGYFSGTFTTSKKIQGIWKDSKNIKQLPYVLQEEYGRDAIEFETISVEKQCLLFPEKPEPYADITITLLNPVKFRNTEAAEKIKKNSILKDGYTDPRKALEKFINEYSDEYREQFQEDRDYYTDDNVLFFKSSFFLDQSVELNDKAILVIEADNYQYRAGAAHGLGNTKYNIFDLETGSLITFTDIFKENTQKELSALLEARAREQLSLRVGESLTNAGFFKNTIPVNNNFYINFNGIGFYYNSYEIAPYAAGPSDIFLTFDKINHLIKEHSPVQRLMKK